MNNPSNWLLHCPAPRSGSIAEGYYNAGPMGADDRRGPTGEDTKIQIVTGAAEADFDRYLQELKDRYRTQLDYYEEAIGRLTGKRVKQKLLYSFALEDTIGWSD